MLRWVKIRSEANPYDPAWELYLEERMAWKMGHTLAGRGRIDYLWKEQGGKCAVCRQPLPVEEQPWHIHHRVWRCFGGQDDVRQPGVVARQLPPADPRTQETLIGPSRVLRGTLWKA